MYRRLILLLAASISVAAAADVRTVEEIVAKANNDIITRGELAHARLEIEAELRQMGLSGPKLQQALQEKAADALRDQIDQLLLVQKAKDLNINVDSEMWALPVLAASSTGGRGTLPLDGNWQVADSVAATDIPTSFTHTAPVPGLTNLATPAFPDVDQYVGREN